MEPNHPQPKSPIGDSISFAFNAITSNVGAWLWIMLMLWGVAVVGSIILQLFLAIAAQGLGFQFFSIRDVMTFCYSRTESIEINVSADLFVFVFYASLALGFTQTLLNFYKTNQITYRPCFDLYTIGVFMLNFMLVILCIVAGLIFFIIPGIIILMRTVFFTNYFIVDKNLGPVEALKATWALTQGKGWMIFKFLMIVTLINFIPIFGWLMTGLMSVYMYEQLSAMQHSAVEL